MRTIIGIVLVAAAAVPGSLTAGETERGAMVFAQADDYIAEIFADTTQPEVSTLWPNAELREQLESILGHNPSLRFRYWGAAGKTVWILDEVGRDRPITAGVVIDQNKITDVQVLVFRESRGWEIRHDFFTRQFANLWLKRNHRLSDRVDNISGATMSVKAMTRMARAALLLHKHSNQNTRTLALSALNR